MAVEWSEHAIWWHVYPLGFVGAPQARATRVPPRTGRPDRGAGWTTRRDSARPGSRWARSSRPDPRLRHRRPLPHRPPARRRRRLRRAGRGGPRARAAGAARRRVQPRRPRVPGVPAGAGAGPVGADRVLVPAALAARDGARRRAAYDATSRAMTAWSRWTTTARRGRPRRRGDDPLARPRRRRLAARRGLRRAAGVLGAGAAAGARAPTRRVDRRRGHPRRLRRVVAETGMDSVTQYELWKAIWSALNDAQLLRAGRGR